ncbi:MAG: DMT family transporter [Holosporales bacterium]
MIPRRPHLIGILFMLASMLTYAFVNASVKSVIMDYPAPQVLFFRYAPALIPYVFLILHARHDHPTTTSNLRWHMGSACVSIISLWALFTALGRLPLAEVTALTFTSVFFVVLLAAGFLKERTSLGSWIALAVGFGGVMIMVNPQHHLLNKNALLCLMAAFGDAVIMVLARRLTRQESSLTVVFYFALFGALITSLFLPFVWQRPTLPDLGLLLFLGLGGGMAQLLLTKAYEYAPAGVVAPFIYTSLIWATLIGYGFWHEAMEGKTLIGAALVVASGVFVTRHHQAKTAKD